MLVDSLFIEWVTPLTCPDKLLLHILNVTLYLVNDKQPYFHVNRLQYSPPSA